MKKAQSVVNTILMLGILFIAGIIIIMLRKFLFFEAQIAEEELADHLADQITIAVEKALAYPTDAKYVVLVPYTDEYELNVSNGEISLYFPERNLRVKKPFIVANVNILQTSIKNSGKIYIYRSGKNILVTDEERAP